MNFKGYIIALFTLFFSGIAFSQNYKIENLGEAVNSEYEEINPVLSGDGRKLFFVRVNHPDNKMGEKDSHDIWYSELDEKGNWSQAERLSDFINLATYNAVVWANQSGNELIITGEFDKKGLTWKKRGLSKIVGKDDKWTVPEAIQIDGFDNLNDGAFNSYSISENGSMMVLGFTSTLDSKKSQIYISVKIKDKYSRPVKIKDLSSKFDDQAPFINADHNKIYFSSNRSTGNGDYKLYSSDKQSTNDWTNWSEPQEFDFGQAKGGYISYFKMAADGNSAVFVSDQNSIGNSDIFRVVFEEEKPKEIRLNAVIIDEINGKPIPSIDFDITLNGASVDYILKDADSARFEFSVVERDSIVVSGKLSGYTVSTLSFNTEYAGNNLNDIVLLARKIEAFKPAMLSISARGTLTDRDDGTPISQSANIRFLINDEVVDSVTYNSFDGNYQMNFDSPDSTLVLSVNADGYLPYTKIIYFDSLLVVNHNVSLKKRTSSILVSGRIINAKTSIPIEKLEGVGIMINGKPSNNFKLLSEEKSYQLYLNKDSIYTITAQMKGFFGTTKNINLRSITSTTLQQDLLLTPVEVGQTVQLNNIFFGTGSADLLPESIPELNRVADFLRENPSVVVEIAGHTDSVGSDSYNLDLSEKRAKSVARYIILKGFSRERIEFKGYGETSPIMPNDTPESREQNRRVEFKVIRN